MYSLDVLFPYLEPVCCHVQFYLLLPDLHTDFKRQVRWSGIPISQNFPVCCDANNQRLWHSQ